MPALHLLFHALQEMAKGNAVTLLSVDTELTTQQAAELLRVSRPFWMLVFSTRLRCAICSCN